MTASTCSTFATPSNTFLNTRPPARIVFCGPKNPGRRRPQSGNYWRSHETHFCPPQRGSFRHFLEAHRRPARQAGARLLRSQPSARMGCCRTRPAYFEDQSSATSGRAQLANVAGNIGRMPRLLAHPCLGIGPPASHILGRRLCSRLGCRRRVRGLAFAAFFFGQRLFLRHIEPLDQHLFPPGFSDVSPWICS